jgi:hypothetical protein
VHLVGFTVLIYYYALSTKHIFVLIIAFFSLSWRSIETYTRMDLLYKSFWYFSICLLSGCILGGKFCESRYGKMANESISKHCYCIKTYSIDLRLLRIFCVTGGSSRRWLYLSWHILCNFLFSPWNSVLPCSEEQALFQLWCILRLVTLQDHMWLYSSVMTGVSWSLGVMF